jgi:hypothetical protein
MIDQHNFWGYLITGLASIIMSVVSHLTFLTHQQIGMVNIVTYFCTTALGVVFTVIFSMIDMTYPSITLGVILLLETIRILIVAIEWVWKLIKLIIPIIAA